MNTFKLWSHLTNSKGGMYGSNCLSSIADGYYHGDYHTKAENISQLDQLSSFILTLKNDNGWEELKQLELVKNEVIKIFKEDLSQILADFHDQKFTVCLVPRAKSAYPPEKLMLRTALKEALQTIESLEDGVDYIVRVKDTKTTHIHNQDDDAPEPYKGITKDTCHISSAIKDKNIILVDDVYTRNKHIDEDAIQALRDLGAKTVVLYVLGKTAGYQS